MDWSPKVGELCGQCQPRPWIRGKVRLVLTSGLPSGCEVRERSSRFPSANVWREYEWLSCERCVDPERQRRLPHSQGAHFMNPSFADHFSALARRYAEFRPKYPAELFDFLATQVPREATVWDCAAGNGQATLDLAKRFERVFGTDASAEQIASAPAVPSIEWRVAPADHSGFPEASVDLVTVAQAIHWFPFDRFYAEVRRVLTPGGLLAVWAYGACRVDAPAVQELITEYYESIVGSFWPPERRFVEEGYRTIPFPFAELECPPISMQADWKLDELLGYFGTWSATHRYRKATDLDPLEPLRASLLPHWGDPAQARRIVWPLALRAGRVE